MYEGMFIVFLMDKKRDIDCSLYLIVLLINYFIFIILGYDLKIGK